MGQVLRQLNISFIDLLKEDIEDGNNYYVFVSRSYPWNDDFNPPEENLTLRDSNHSLRNDVLFAKKLQPSDVSFMIRRIPWIEGEAYVQYDSEIDTTNQNYFVLNSTNNVYLCLDNNGGGLSTSEPTFISTEPAVLADGYKWKYLFTLSSLDESKFANPTLIPYTANNQVENSFLDGEINDIIITNPGTNYITNSGLIQEAVSNTVYRIEPSALNANGAYTGSSVYIADGTGSGSIRNITNYTSNTSGRYIELDDSLVLDISSSYLISPRVRIDGNGTGAQAYSEVEDTEIVRINVVNTGSLYTDANISIIANTVYGEDGEARPIVSIIGDNKVKNVLNTTRLGISLDINGTELDTIPADINYRQVGIWKNPRLFSNNEVLMTDPTFSQVLEFDNTLSGGQPFFNNEEIVGDLSGTTGRIVSSSISSSTATVFGASTFTNGETIVGQESGVSAIIFNISERDVDKYSGEIIYYKNIQPVERSESTNETVRLIIRT